MREYSSRFLYWVTNTDQLGRNTRKYYRFGWERLKDTPLAGMRLDAITTDAVSLVPFPGSAAWGNQARRTLRVMLGKAVRDSLIRQAPRIHLVDETGRDGILDDATEAKLLAVARQPLKDVLLIRRYGTQACGGISQEMGACALGQAALFQPLRQVAQGPPLGALEPARI